MPISAPVTVTTAPAPPAASPAVMSEVRCEGLYSAKTHTVPPSIDTVIVESAVAALSSPESREPIAAVTNAISRLKESAARRETSVHAMITAKNEGMMRESTRASGTDIAAVTTATVASISSFRASAPSALSNWTTYPP